MAKKKVLKSINKCPHVNPAKSNKGLGIEAIKRIVIKECFLTYSNIFYFVTFIILSFYLELFNSVSYSSFF